MRGGKGVGEGKLEVLHTVLGHYEVEMTYHKNEDSMFTFHGSLRSKTFTVHGFQFRIFNGHENSKHLIPYHAKTPFTPSYETIDIREDL